MRVFERKTAPIVDIWGSCVSREIFNYNPSATVGAYILQNPIHTLWGESYPIPDEKILGTCNFTRRMAKLNFKKLAVDYFFDNFKGDFLMIDTCDCRTNRIHLENNEKYCICENISTAKTIKEYQNETHIAYSTISPFSIDLSVWKEYIKRFALLIKDRFPEERIIINEFIFAEKYLDEDGEIKVFEKAAQYHHQNILTTQITELFKTELPNAKLLPASKNPLGDTNHHLGLYTVHYTKDWYEEKNKELSDLLGL